MGLRILGTGAALPALRRPTSDIERTLGLPPGALEAETGVAARHVVGGDEDQITLAVEAAKSALTAAGIGADDVDLLLSASAVPYQTIPATAPFIMAGLGMADGAAAGHDVNSTCLGFLTALDTADALIAAGRCRIVLIVCSEIASRALPWEKAPEIAALFGDGAAAVVVDGGGDGGVRAAHFRTFPSGRDACRLGSGGTRYDLRADHALFVRNAVFDMDGKALFRLATRHFGRFVADVLAQAGWRPEDVDCVVPHQASPASLDHMIRQTGFAPERVVRIAHEVGNQIAASIPFALDRATREGRIGTGKRVLMLGTSAGVSFGGVALQT